MNHFNMVTADDAEAQGLEAAAFLSIARWHDRAAKNGDNPRLSRAVAQSAREVGLDLARRAGIDVGGRPRPRPSNPGCRANNDNRGHDGRGHEGRRFAKRRAA